MAVGDAVGASDGASVGTAVGLGVGRVREMSITVIKSNNRTLPLVHALSNAEAANDGSVTESTTEVPNTSDTATSATVSEAAPDGPLNASEAAAAMPARMRSTFRSVTDPASVM